MDEREYPTGAENNFSGEGMGFNILQSFSPFPQETKKNMKQINM